MAVNEKEQAIAVFKNIKAVLGAGLFFGEHAAVIHQCQVFIDQLIAQNETSGEEPLATSPAYPDVEEVSDVQAE